MCRCILNVGDAGQRGVWCARLCVQDIGLQKGIRFTLLSGDVHLAAVGRFVGNAECNLEHDHRYTHTHTHTHTHTPPDLLCLPPKTHGESTGHRLHMSGITTAVYVCVTHTYGTVYMFVCRVCVCVCVSFRYIPQIISSAIGNVPPPDGVVTALTRFADPKQFDTVSEPHAVSLSLSRLSSA